MTKRHNLIADLLKKDKYVKYLESAESEFLKNILQEMRSLYALPFKEQYPQWKKLVGKIKDSKELDKLANPYYIGFGNPNAQLLIIGKEKAFNATDNPELLFLESINNTTQWNELIEKNVEWGDSIFPIFDPRCPRIYHNKIPKGTWFKYCTLLSTFLKASITPDTLFKDNFKDSFFKHCFCTELNHIPSASSNNIPISDERAEFLSNQFYRDFDYVLIAGVSSLGKTYAKQRKEIKKIFDADIVKERITLKGYGRKVVRLYKSDSQVIVTCAQLGGNARWRNEHIEELGLILQNAKL